MRSLPLRTGNDMTQAASAGDGRISKRQGRPFWASWAVGLIVPAVLVGIWAWVTSTGLVPSSRLPGPGQVLAAGKDLMQDGTLMRHVAISTQRVLIGFVAGSVAGLVVGAIIGLSKRASALFGPTIEAFRAVPSLAWVPLLILWLGIGEDSKVLLIAIGAFFPVFTNFSTALQHVDQKLVEAGEAFGHTGVDLLVNVQFPAVLPSVFSGLRLALAQSWLFLVAAELIASSMGLGFLLTDSQNNGRVDRLLLAIVLLAVLGKVSDEVLAFVQKLVLRNWG